MEYKRCIKITDNSITDFREYMKTLVNVNTSNSAWGWDSTVSLQADIKEAVLKILSDKACRNGTQYMPLMYAYYSVDSNGNYTHLHLILGYYIGNEYYMYIKIEVSLTNNTIHSKYAEI